MFPNVRLMIVATAASVVVLSLGFGLFAAFRVNHEPLARLATVSAPLQLVSDYSAPSTDAIGPGRPLGARFQLSNIQVDSAVAPMPTLPSLRRDPAPARDIATLPEQSTPRSPVPIEAVVVPPPETPPPLPQANTPVAIASMPVAEPTLQPAPDVAAPAAAPSSVPAPAAVAAIVPDVPSAPPAPEIPPQQPQSVESAQPEVLPPQQKPVQPPPPPAAALAAPAAEAASPAVASQTAALEMPRQDIRPALQGIAVAHHIRRAAWTAMRSIRKPIYRRRVAVKVYRVRRARIAVATQPASQFGPFPSPNFQSAPPAALSFASPSPPLQPSAVRSFTSQPRPVARRLAPKRGAVRWSAARRSPRRRIVVRGLAATTSPGNSFVAPTAVH